MKQMKEQDIEINSPISYSKFIALLKELEFYTMLYTFKTPADFLDKLEEVWNESGSSMLPTNIIAPTQKEDVDAGLCEQSEDLGGTLDELLGFTSGQSGDGGILSFITKNHQDVLSTLKSEEGYGCEVIKLEVYPFHQVGIDKYKIYKYN